MIMSPCPFERQSLQWWEDPEYPEYPKKSEFCRFQTLNLRSWRSWFKISIFCRAVFHHESSSGGKCAQRCAVWNIWLQTWLSQDQVAWCRMLSHVTAWHCHVLPKQNSLKCCQVASPHTQKKRRPRECGANRSSNLTSLTDNSQQDNRQLIQLQLRHNTTTASKWMCEAYSNQLMRQMAVGSSWWYRKPPDRPRQHQPTVDPAGIWRIRHLSTACTSKDR